jgi:hypothetical protein
MISVLLKILILKLSLFGHLFYAIINKKTRRVFVTKTYMSPTTMYGFIKIPPVA